MELTDAQREAVLYKGRNLQLIACAGSGKTEVLAQRVAHLLTRQDGQRLQPRNIVAFTFTEKAAAELKERVIERTQEALGASPLGMAEMYVGTIHGFCQDLLQTNLPEYLKYEVLDAVRQNLYINRKTAKTGLTTSTKINGSRLRRWVDTNNYIQALSILREDTSDQSELEDCSVFSGLQAYQEQLAADGYFDFSALLAIAVRELRDNSSLRRTIAERIKYVIVDEYQDVNPVQEQLLYLLHELGAGLCVVGDDDQAIYQWRGSSVRNIIEFSGRYPEVKQITIAENFRSSQGIIDTARGFIDKIGERLPKSMQFGGAQQYEDGDVVALHFETPREEAQYIAKTISSLHGLAFNDGGTERGLSWSDMAVLLRSVNQNGGVIKDAFDEAGVPYIVTGLANLFEMEEARAARAIFYYLNDEASIDSVREAWVSPRFGLAKKNLDSGVRYVKQLRVRLGMGNSSDFPRLQKIFLDFLESVDLKEERIPNELGEVVFYNLGRFSQIISDWESINFNSDVNQRFWEFAGFLRHQADGSYSEGSDSYATPDAVQVMTVHQAKGREWPVVFVPALLRNRFPSISKQSQVWHLIPRSAFDDASRYDGSLDDERRLFYVAMTRSKKFLHMTWAPISGKSNWYIKASDFWNDVLSSKWVKRRRADYTTRKRIKAEPRTSVANVEFSFSDLKYLFECAYQFKLRVLYGFNGPLAAPLGFGKSLHDALAEVHKRAMQGDFVGEQEVPDLVQRHLRTPYAFGELRASLERAAHKNLANYIRDNAEKLPYIEYSEQPVEIDLQDGIIVKGRIDLVRRTDTGQTTIVDLKSNERSQHEDVTELQLHTYALGYRDLTGQDADFVEIYELDERKAKPRTVENEFIEDIRKRTREAATTLREKRLPPTPSSLKCGPCDFKMLCSAAAV